MSEQFSQYLLQFQDDISRLETIMHDNLKTHTHLIIDMKNHDYLIGGKRLRAIITLLCCQHYHVDATIADQVATAIEFIHTATLLHDDVVDDSPTRRHLPTAASVYGSAAAVLAGDFLYSRASQIFANIGNVPLLRQVANATNKLSEGEILQLIQRGCPETSEENYFTIIQYKTANLFQTAACAAPLLKNQNSDALSAYGRYLGISFQLTDDCLDFYGDTQKTGKKIGTDFDEGKMTLPTIIMLSRIDQKKRHALIEKWHQQHDGVFDETRELIIKTNALTETQNQSKYFINQAINAIQSLENTKAKSTLIELAENSVYRNG